MWWLRQLGLVLLVCTLFSHSSFSRHIVIVSSSQQLDNQMREFSESSNGDILDIVLDSGVDYQLFGNGFYHFANKTFNLASDTRGIMVTVSCWNETGMVFVNSTATFSSVTFENCGVNLALLPGQVLSVVNETLLYYQTGSSVGFLFIFSSVSMDMVRISCSRGFAVIAFNIFSSSFYQLQIVYSKSINGSYGSGMLIHFNDSIKFPNLHMAKKVSFTNVTFANNVGNGSLLSKESIANTMLSLSQKHFPVYNAGGLTVLFLQNTFNAYVSINGGDFTNNSAAYCGGILILHFQSSSISKTDLRNLLFTANWRNSSAGSHGSAINFLLIGNSPRNNTNALNIANAKFNVSLETDLPIFMNNTAGLIYIGVYSFRAKIIFTFKFLEFYDNNRDRQGGPCIMIYSCSHFHKKMSNNRVEVVLFSLTANNIRHFTKHHTLQNLFQFENIDNVTFAGHGNFSNNFGPVISAYRSIVFLHDFIYFFNNTGEKGGCIHLSGKSLLYFMNNVKATFKKNKAFLFGGAIYANTYPHHENCSIQIMNFTNAENITMTGNTANLAGNAIYAVPVTHCFVNNVYEYRLWLVRYQRYFLHHLDYNSGKGPLEFSTYPDVFEMWCKNENGYEMLDESQELPSKYPGEIINIKIVVLDVIRRSVFAFLNLEVFKMGAIAPAHLWIKSNGENKISEGKGNSSFQFSVHSNYSHTHDVVVVFTLINAYSRAYKMQLRPCPRGFVLNSNLGICDCFKVFSTIHREGTRCLINGRLIFIPNRQNIWIGLINNDMKVSSTCPFTYCSNDPSYQYIKINDEMVLIQNKTHLNDTKPFCLGNRIGILCGQCNRSGNFSLALGSYECHPCSGAYVFPVALFVFIFAGIFLIFLLFVLKLTLTTGVLNGIIFYAQVANAGLLEQIAVTYSQSNEIQILYKISSSVLKVISLKSAFPLCLPKTVTQIWKTFIGLLFPVHLLLTVVILMIISRYWTWFANKTSHLSVQVLITIVHLSFANILLLAIDVFTPATIYSSTHRYNVWYWDGSVDFMGSQHCPLAVVSALLVCGLLVPYLVLLLIGKSMISRSTKLSLYLRPILEAIYAPYKPKKQYWFALKLVVVIIIYIMYVFLRTVDYDILNMLISTILALVLIGQAVFRPFKSKLLNLLDCFLVLNIGLVYFLLSSIKDLFVSYFVVVSVLSALLSSCMIIIYHINFVQRLCRKIVSKPLSQNIPKVNSRQRLVADNHDSFYESDNLRESLLNY